MKRPKLFGGIQNAFNAGLQEPVWQERTLTFIMSSLTEGENSIQTEGLEIDYNSQNFSKSETK